MKSTARKDLAERPFEKRARKPSVRRSRLVSRAIATATLEMQELAGFEDNAARACVVIRNAYIPDGLMEYIGAMAPELARGILLAAHAADEVE